MQSLKNGLEFSESQSIGGLLHLLKTKFLCNTYIGLTNKIGATIMGVKPAELINLTLCKEKNNMEWETYKSCLFDHTGVRIREIRILNGRLQVLVYHEKALEDTLSHQVTLKFLRSLGYPSNYSLSGYLDILYKRLNQNLFNRDFPHEIGIFLGYPLKDVIGYIGHPSLPLVSKKGWNYYGNTKASNIQYEKFLRARTQVKEFIDAQI